MAESAVVLGVAGVLTATALPNLAGLAASRQLQDEVDLLRGALRLARSQALRRDEQVTVCPLAAAEGAEPACQAGGKDWSRGWMVFVDRGQRERFEPGDVRLMVQALPASRVTVLGTASAVSFRGTGVQWALSSRFNFGAAGAAPQVVCVNKVGRARQAAGTAC